MGPKFDGGPAVIQTLTVPYLTEGPSCAQNLTYYPPLLTCSIRLFLVFGSTCGSIQHLESNRTGTWQCEWEWQTVVCYVAITVSTA